MRTKQKSKNPSMANQLLVVNSSAGRLRFVLLSIVFFIIWSLIAQTNLPLPMFMNGFIAILPKPTNFTSGIIQEILLMYFSPKTIFFTFIPLIIFFFINKIITQFIYVLFPDIKKKIINTYLFDCAFSFYPTKYSFKVHKNTDSRRSREQVSKLGGPAKISFHPDSFSIIAKMNNNTDYALIQNKDITENEYSLSFGEKIVSIISKFDNKIYCDQISFHDRSGRHFQVNKMDLAFDIDHSKRESRPLFPKYITEPDAMFLSDLGGDGKEMIRSFFIDEVKLFLCSELSIANCDANLLTHEKQDHEKFSNSLKKTNHSNYNRGIAISKLFSNTIYRKHKHSVYPFLKKQTMSIGDIQDRQQEMDAVVRKLLLYLNKQLRSFFHTSNILIKLNDIDESSAVTRFSKIANNSFPF